MRDFVIAFRSPWASRDFYLPPFRFAPHIPSTEADALLVFVEPTEEIVTFRGRKAYYCCEPITTCSLWRSHRWLAVKDRLRPGEFLNHWDPDPQLRVPHITHLASAKMIPCTERAAKACTVVSNWGGPSFLRTHASKLRRRFATHRLVDLYGRRSSWEQFRAHLLSRPALPRNYKGEIPGDWSSTAKTELMAQYKVAVCLENTCEPYYFTEKFVDAVLAGCIPVYHAHDTVRKGVLQGAAWIDPADFNYAPAATLAFALGQNLERYQRQNEAWLHSSAVVATREDNILRRIGALLMEPDSARNAWSDGRSAHSGAGGGA